MVIGTGWDLTGVRLVRPRLAPCLEEFLDAWNRHDLARVREWVEPGAREKAERTLAQLDGRGWPRLGPGRTQVWFDVLEAFFPGAEGALEVGWGPESGETWRVRGLFWVPDR